MPEGPRQRVFFARAYRVVRVFGLAFGAAGLGVSFALPFLHGVQPDRKLAAVLMVPPFAALWLWIIWRNWREFHACVVVDVDHEILEVRNFNETVRVAWDDVSHFEVERRYWGPSNGRVVLADGRKVQMLAVSGPDPMRFRIRGKKLLAMIAELNRLLGKTPPDEA